MAAAETPILQGPHGTVLMRLIVCHFLQAQLRNQNEGAMRDMALKAGAIRDLRAECDSGRKKIEILQTQV